MTPFGIGLEVLRRFRKSNFLLMSGAGFTRCSTRGGSSKPPSCNGAVRRGVARRRVARCGAKPWRGAARRGAARRGAVRRGAAVEHKSMTRCRVASLRLALHPVCHVLSRHVLPRQARRGSISTCPSPRRGARFVALRGLGADALPALPQRLVAEHLGLRVRGAGGGDEHRLGAGPGADQLEEHLQVVLSGQPRTPVRESFEIPVFGCPLRAFGDDDA